MINDVETFSFEQEEWIDSQDDEYMLQLWQNTESRIPFSSTLLNEMLDGGLTRKCLMLIMGGSHQLISLPAISPALHLVQHIRDESHRFAIAGHRAKRGKLVKKSTLEDIPGIGPKKRH